MYAPFYRIVAKDMKLNIGILPLTVSQVAPRLVPAQQRTPIWERNPQVRHPSLCFSGQCSSYKTLHMIVIFHMQFTAQATSGIFSAIFINLKVISSQFRYFTALLAS